MTCKRCRRNIAADQARCPHCGEPKPEGTGLFQTSTVLISAGGADLVYRSVEEVPAAVEALRALCQRNGRSEKEVIDEGRLLAV